MAAVGFALTGDGDGGSGGAGLGSVGGCWDVAVVIRAGDGGGGFAGFALLLLEDFGATFAEVGQADEADGCVGEALVGCLVLGGEAGGGGGLV